MKNNQLTNAQWAELLREIRQYLKQQGIIRFQKEDIMFENDVCDMLRITPRTLLNLRKDGIIHCAKFRGQCIYIRSILFFNIIENYDKE
ncbi:helix-turn-helix domain-containing protein [Epilithonimonas sp.]|uniref:helix-turn-helix domain-containing protein n=1 Tax=Epilithonimonas sp. TaxID=2894511 RepID=UPI002FDDAF58